MLVSFWNVRKTRYAYKELKSVKQTMEYFREFYEWGTETKILVRDKLAHENVSDIRVLDLWVIFRTGDAFRNAKLLWDNDEFKVYAQGKQEDLGEWESIRQANEGE